MQKYRFDDFTEDEIDDGEYSKSSEPEELNSN